MTPEEQEKWERLGYLKIHRQCFVAPLPAADIDWLISELEESWKREEAARAAWVRLEEKIKETESEEDGGLRYHDDKFCLINPDGIWEAVSLWALLEVVRLYAEEAAKESQ